MKHIVGFSGGIDSQACARWVLNRFPAEDVILINSDAGGNEHPLTTEFIDWYSDNVHHVVKLSPTIADLEGRAKVSVEERGLKPDDPLTFPLLAELKHIFPARKSAFCTHHLKLVPQKRWILANVEDAFTRYAGVRRDESQNRKNAPYHQWDETFDCDLYRPLMDWTKKMCFDYVTAHGEKFNQLYTLGFDRVGCSPCVNANKDDIRAWADRFPEMIDKVREWEKQVGKTFFRPVRRDGVLTWIDDVVEWSRTTRGGTQLAIAFERPTCESSYGLCE